MSVCAGSGSPSRRYAPPGRTRRDVILMRNYGGYGRVRFIPCGSAQPVAHSDGAQAEIRGSGAGSSALSRPEILGSR